jgi:hypothetical protein
MKRETKMAKILKKRKKKGRKRAVDARKIT